jgi:uncharacterized protein Smg (DUF494 family)
MKKIIEELKKDLSHLFEAEFLDKLTEQELLELLEEAKEREKNHRKPYNRSLDIVESRAMTTRAHGYLIEMYNIGALDLASTEKVIQLCLHVYFATDEAIDKVKMDKIITMVKFAEASKTNVKEMIEPLIHDNGKNINTIFKDKH